MKRYQHKCNNSLQRKIIATVFFLAIVTIFLYMNWLKNTYRATDEENFIDEVLFENNNSLEFGDITELFSLPKYERILSGNKEEILNRFEKSEFKIFLVPCSDRLCTSSYVMEKRYSESLLGYVKLRFILHFNKDDLVDFVVKYNYVGL